MLKNYCDNIICRFFKAIAAFWNNTARYQIFVILAAIGLLAILPFFGDKLGSTTNAIFNILIFCSIASAGFMLLRIKGSYLAAFTFAAALFLRLCLVFVLENSTPQMFDEVRTRTQPWIKHYNTALFDADEFFYIYQGQKYSDTSISKFINSPEFTFHAHRSGFLVSRLFSFFGEDFIWIRLVGAFLGAFAAAFVCLSAQELFSKATSYIVSLIAALAPQTAFYSVRFLKEIWIVFAASLMVLGFIRIIRNKNLFWAVLSIIIAFITFAWFRVEYSLLFIAVVPIVICYRHKSNPAGKTIGTLSLIFVITMISFYQFNRLTHKAEDMFGKYTLMERGRRGNIETIKIMDQIYRSHGPLRFLNMPLVLINPSPKNLHSIFTSENKLYELVKLSDIYQWWIPLPFLIIGIAIIISNRTELLALLLPYIAVISISAILLGGLHGGVLRYRDSLAPIAFIIIGAGIEGFASLSKGWKNRIIIAIYMVFIICTYLYYQLFIFS